jgi:hypothetical protein
MSTGRDEEEEKSEEGGEDARRRVTRSRAWTHPSEAGSHRRLAVGEVLEIGSLILGPGDDGRERSSSASNHAVALQREEKRRTVRLAESREGEAEGRQKRRTIGDIES